MITPSALPAMHSRMFHLMLATAQVSSLSSNMMHFLHFDSSPIFVTHTHTHSTHTASFE